MTASHASHAKKSGSASEDPYSRKHIKNDNTGQPYYNIPPYNDFHDLTNSS